MTVARLSINSSPAFTFVPTMGVVSRKPLRGSKRNSSPSVSGSLGPGLSGFQSSCHRANSHVRDQVRATDSAHRGTISSRRD
jgi:hypothetical protein